MPLHIPAIASPQLSLFHIPTIAPAPRLCSHTLPTSLPHIPRYLHIPAITPPHSLLRSLTLPLPSYLYYHHTPYLRSLPHSLHTPAIAPPHSLLRFLTPPLPSYPSYRHLYIPYFAPSFPPLPSYTSYRHLYIPDFAPSFPPLPSYPSYRHPHTSHLRTLSPPLPIRHIPTNRYSRKLCMPSALAYGDL